MVLVSIPTLNKYLPPKKKTIKTNNPSIRSPGNQCDSFNAPDSIETPFNHLPDVLPPRVTRRLFDEILKAWLRRVMSWISLYKGWASPLLPLPLLPSPSSAGTVSPGLPSAGCSVPAVILKSRTIEIESCSFIVFQAAMS